MRKDSFLKTDSNIFYTTSIYELKAFLMGKEQQMRVLYIPSYVTTDGIAYWGCVDANFYTHYDICLAMTSECIIKNLYDYWRKETEEFNRLNEWKKSLKTATEKDAFVYSPISKASEIWKGIRSIKEDKFSILYLYKDYAIAVKMGGVTSIGEKFLSLFGKPIETFETLSDWQDYLFDNMTTDSVDEDYEKEIKDFIHQYDENYTFQTYKGGVLLKQINDNVWKSQQEHFKVGEYLSCTFTFYVINGDIQVEVNSLRNDTRPLFSSQMYKFYEPNKRYSLKEMNGIINACIVSIEESKRNEEGRYKQEEKLKQERDFYSEKLENFAKEYASELGIEAYEHYILNNFYYITLKGIIDNYQTEIEIVFRIDYRNGKVCLSTYSISNENINKTKREEIDDDKSLTFNDIKAKYNKEYIEQVLNELNETRKQELQKREQEDKRKEEFMLSHKNIDDLSDEPITQGSNYVGGYSKYSMSNSAVASEEQGSLPYSRWTKNTILDTIKENTDELDFLLPYLQKLTSNELKYICLYNDGWHHTSKFYNKTNFYSLSSPRKIYGRYLGLIAKEK